MKAALISATFESQLEDLH